MMTGGGLMLVLLGRGFVMVLEVRERVRERDDKNTSVRDVRVLCCCVVLVSSYLQNLTPLPQNQSHK